MIGGLTEPAGGRVGFGALLGGHHEGERLRYAGKAGTGHDVRERAAHWVRPELVAQIGLTEWTGAGRLRHPRSMGLRDDKRPPTSPASEAPHDHPRDP
ncbi:hypothetical protein [Streptomyces sp. NK15101]|uniref:ATP dependent DNA ligase n=1 Tax=Streptomyces sp. NK15101 TaxID=2873261 RepID=UPI001CEDB24F|nr:hypothetical protein [Streptomyces sp. NK15101]